MSTISNPLYVAIKTGGLCHMLAIVSCTDAKGGQINWKDPDEWFIFTTVSNHHKYYTKMYC